MKYIFLLFISALAITTSAQSKVDRLYLAKQYDAIIAYQKEGKVKSGPDYFKVGMAQMKKENDTAAIRMFKKAINQGLKNGDVYYNMAIAYNNQEFYKQGTDACKMALMYIPKRKPYLLELAAGLYQLNNLDSTFATYKYIQKLYPENQLSAFMSCQVLYEQEKFNACLDCFYMARGKFKDYNKFFRDTYESIARLEWYNFNRLDKAETAIKNLMKAYPGDVEYQLWLLQLFHFQNKFDEALPLTKGIEMKYNDASLPQKYYTKGAYLIDNYNIEGHNLEVYKNFQPEKHNGEVYKVFVFTKSIHKMIGKISVTPTQNGFDLLYTLYNNTISFSEKSTYQNVKPTLSKIVLTPVNTESIDSTNFKNE